MSKPMKTKVANCDLEETARVRTKILVVRGHRVMLDGDLSKLYGVTTKRLNEQLRRNRHRFPEDFAFHLTLEEAKEIAALRSQIATLKRGQHIKHPPYVFTEHGAIMLASVLNRQGCGPGQHLRRTCIRGDAGRVGGIRGPFPKDRQPGSHL